MNKLKIFLVIMVLGTALSLPSVWAEEKYSLKEITPAAETALEGRRNRFDELSDLKARGSVGENNRGYVEALVDDLAVKALVEAENKDRAVIYNIIAEQNGLVGALETIERVFAQVQSEKSSPGTKIQDENGAWITK